MFTPPFSFSDWLLCRRERMARARRTETIQKTRKRVRKAGIFLGSFLLHSLRCFEAWSSDNFSNMADVRRDRRSRERRRRDRDRYVQRLHPFRRCSILNS
jgi:hypothetical protein